MADENQDPAVDAPAVDLNGVSTPAHPDGTGAGPTSDNETPENSDDGPDDSEDSLDSDDSPDDSEDSLDSDDSPDDRSDDSQDPQGGEDLAAPAS